MASFHHSTRNWSTRIPAPVWSLLYHSLLNWCIKSSYSVVSFLQNPLSQPAMVWNSHSQSLAQKIYIINTLLNVDLLLQQLSLTYTACQILPQVTGQNPPQNRRFWRKLETFWISLSQTQWLWNWIWTNFNQGPTGDWSKTHHYLKYARWKKQIKPGLHKNE